MLIRLSAIRVYPGTGSERATAAHGAGDRRGDAQRLRAAEGFGRETRCGTPSLAASPSTMTCIKLERSRLIAAGFGFGPWSQRSVSARYTETINHATRAGERSCLR